MSDISAIDQLTILVDETIDQLRTNTFHPQDLNPELAKLLLAVPTVDPEGRKNIRLAVEVADRMTREEAQNLYHFAVLVTKLYS